jgi:hypothetical protein
MASRKNTFGSLFLYAGKSVAEGGGGSIDEAFGFVSRSAPQGALLVNLLRAI